MNLLVYSKPSELTCVWPKGLLTFRKRIKYDNIWKSMHIIFVIYKLYITFITDQEKLLGNGIAYLEIWPMSSVTATEK